MDCWHRELDLASTESDVARRASDYLSLWGRDELAPLTHGWREVRVETGDDVRALKNRLLDSPAALHELAGYFWHAAERIERIRAARR